MPDPRDHFAAWETARLRQHAAKLRAELESAEHELERRGKLCLGRFPLRSFEPETPLPDEAAHAAYLERMEDEIENAVGALGCHPCVAYPWVEVWGPPRALGSRPDITLNEIVRDAHTRARAWVGERNGEAQPA